ncbi:MAG: ATP-binding protein [Oscillospiraceae bacterium]|nr:ATP-binding protein [Oscillospiraceae bacterium]
MKNRIFLNFLGLILLCVLLTSISVSLLAHNVGKRQEIAAIKDRTVLAADLLNNGVDFSSYNDYSNYKAETARITLIAPDGTVLLDNKADASVMGNHADREEFIQATETGSGEATRYSETLREETYYYAVLLDDGNVLRVSKITSRINIVFDAVMPAIVAIAFVILIIAAILARRLAKNILAPLNWIDFTGENVAAYDELVPYMKKIDRQKREIALQITALEEKANTIEAIMANMREGVLLLDRNQMILMANKSVSEFIESDLDYAGKSILEVVRAVDFIECVKKAFTGERCSLTTNDKGRAVEVFFSPVKSQNRVDGLIILFFDITEKYKAEKQRREFSANVSHELKTPLTSISGLSELLENNMVKAEDVSGFGAKISEQAKRLVALINDIIKISEFDEAKGDKATEEFELYSLAESVINSFPANSKDVKIKLSGDRFNISANRSMIDELLVNLIDNGIKYNKDGGTVIVILSREYGLYKIIVEDTGIGIPKEHHSRVFERFYRVDKSRCKKTGGTGLGLSIVKHIVEYHGGKVELISTEGVGTTVICFIAI